jgi:predicted metal-dependent peptidase
MRIRLRDPENLKPPDLIQLDKMVTDAMGILAHHPNHGGDPFLFAMAAGKPHTLRSIKMPCGACMGTGINFEAKKAGEEQCKECKGTGQYELETAATNGRELMWHPNGIRKLTLKQVVVRLKHEVLHIALDHCSRGRMADKTHWLWNYAIDFADNTMIEHAWRQQNHRDQTSKIDDFNHPLWNTGLGIPITIEEFKYMLVDEKEDHIDPRKWKMGKDNPLLRVVDMSLFGRSAESIYRELIEWLIEHDKDPRATITLGELIDTINHMPIEIDKQELIRQLTKAIAAAQQMRGNIPSYIEEMLGELSDPQTSFDDYFNRLVRKIKQDGGLNSDYTRFRRRFISQRIYLPTYTCYRPRCIVLLDTSGSMSQKAITLLVSELKVFDRMADILVVPVDAEPHWEAATKVNRASDIPTIKVVGRGGTVFNDFFRDFSSKMRSYGPFDVVVALTDGEFGTIPAELEPNCQVAWVLSKESPHFEPPFGKVVPLHRYEEYATG